MFPFKSRTLGCIKMLYFLCKALCLNLQISSKGLFMTVSCGPPQTFSRAFPHWERSCCWKILSYLRRNCQISSEKCTKSCVSQSFICKIGSPYQVSSSVVAHCLQRHPLSSVSNLLSGMYATGYADVSRHH